MSNLITCRNNFCLPNLLALWALKEMEQSGDDEMTVSFCPDVFNQEEPCSKAELQIERLFERLGMKEILGEGLRGGLEGYDDASASQGLVGVLGFFDPCQFCSRLQKLTRSQPEPSLEALQELVFRLYPDIFNYQVWDLQSGKPLLQQVCLQNTQLNPFTYLCHVSCVYSEAGMKMKCSGIEKAMSLCNIAIVTAVCRFSLELKMERVIPPVWLRHSDTSLLEEMPEVSEQEECLSMAIQQLMEHRTKLQSSVSPEFLFREVHDGVFKIGLWRNIPKGFQNLLDCTFNFPGPDCLRFINGEILTCVSPELK